MQRSKTYRATSESFDKDAAYSPFEAIKIAKAGSKKKFDETVDVAMRLGVDPRKADQMVRGTVNLPHGTGKTARVLVFATGERAEQATAAGADYVGSDIKGGKIEFRVDKHANLHFIIGKSSFDEAKLVENYRAALEEILRLKPSAAKGRYIQKTTLTTTMGPGIPVDPNRTRNLLAEDEASA